MADIPPPPPPPQPTKPEAPFPSAKTSSLSTLIASIKKRFSNPFSGAKNPFTGNIQRATQKKWLIIGVIAVFLVASLGYYFYAAGKGKVLILDTSKDLKITLNNQSVKATKTDQGYTFSVFAGTYRLQIVKPSYLPYVQDIQVIRGQTLTIRPAFAFQPTSQKTEASTVDFVRPSLDEKSIFYLGDSRKTIYRMEIANQVKIPLTDKPLRAVTDVQWSSEPDVALISQPDGVYLREIPKFDYQNQTLVRLGGSEIISPIWDPLNPERIALVYSPSSGEHSLVFTDKRLSSLDRKADISGITNPKLIWSPNDNFILLIGRAADYAKNNIWIYDTTNGSLKQITEGGNVLDASFSPDAQTILYETYTADPTNRFASTLSLMKSDGSGKTPLNINGKVARSAWKDNTSFFLPSDNNSLISYNIKGNPERVTFNFPQDLLIQGMIYFASSKTLIFYTADTIYTVELAS